MSLLIIFSLTFFIILTIVCFTIPGAVLLTLNKSIKSFWDKIILGSVLGFVLFTLISYLQLFVHFNYLSIIAVIAFNFYFFKYQFKHFCSSFGLPSKFRLLILSLVFILGISGQLAVIAPSGLNINGDLVFWSAHGHDGMWHIALMNVLQKGFPIENPIFSGERLVNYHYFSDIAPAFFNFYFNFSKLDLYFRFFPFFFSVMLGSLSFILGKHLGKSFQAGVWAAVFTYFAGSFGYIVTLLNNKTIGGESIFWATQVQSSIGNPPQAAAFIIFLTFAIFLMHFLNNKKDPAIFIFCLILAGSLITFKVYGAVVLFGSLLIISVLELAKKNFQLLVLFACSVIFSLILYLPNSSNSSSFLIFEPWWYVRTMVVATDKLNWIDMELRRQTYISEHNWKRVIQLESTAFLIFFFGNLGMRFIGLISFTKASLQAFKNPLNMFLVSSILISLTLPLLFLQKGVASNTSQFLQYFILLMGIFAGVTTANILSKIRFSLLKTAFMVTIIFFSIPTQLSLIYDFYSKPPLAKISNSELEALVYIQNTPKDAIILSHPYNKDFDQKLSTPNIWDWFDTSYIAAISQRSNFVADYEQLDITGYDFRPRIKLQEEVFKETDPQKFLDLVSQTKAKYLYFPKVLQPMADLEKLPFTKEFGNEEIEIWQLN